ncbi:MAG: hypothetical protein R3B70_16975 [Polyangiaceae bacterium]
MTESTARTSLVLRTTGSKRGRLTRSSSNTFQSRRRGVRVRPTHGSTPARQLFR